VYFYFSTHLQMIPIESFEAQSMNGRFVPIIPGGGNMRLTFHNRKEYVEKALKFRLHELDQQVECTMICHTVCLCILTTFPQLYHTKRPIKVVPSNLSKL
jgi:hypothetical protein